MEVDRNMALKSWRGVPSLTLPASTLISTIRHITLLVERVIIAIGRLVISFQLPARLGVPEVQLILDGLDPGDEFNGLDPVDPVFCAPYFCAAYSQENLLC